MPVEVLAGPVVAAEGTRDPDLVLAAQDAISETQASGVDPILRANAQEAGSQLRLWLQHADDDFAAIYDLRSFGKTPPSGSTSPAHYSEDDRGSERALWEEKKIKTMSIATLARRAFTFTPDQAAPSFELEDPFSWQLDRLVAGAKENMDVSYLLTNRACAGGPFVDPPDDRKGDLRDITKLKSLNREPFAPDGDWVPGERIELWDNDGIVNTASMLWPNGTDTRLVVADHLDIVGQYVLRTNVPLPHGLSRRYASYGSLRSDSGFTPEIFSNVWRVVYDFCATEAE